MNADDRRKALIAARCCGPRTLHTRSADASHNELATGIQAAEDVIDPRDVPPSAKCAALAFAAIDRSLRSCNDQSARTDAATRAAVERMPIPGVTVNYRGGVR
jgi:hypothetical protein